MSTKTLLMLISFMMFISVTIIAIRHEQRMKILHQEKIEILQERIIIQDSIIMRQNKLIPNP